jgi:hypothetical protein
VASALALAWFIVAGGFGPGSALVAIGFVFAVSAVGKLIGLGVARIQLLWLRRALTARLASVEVSRVDMH